MARAESGRAKAEAPRKAVVTGGAPKLPTLTEFYDNIKKIIAARSGIPVEHIDLKSSSNGIVISCPKPYAGKLMDLDSKLTNLPGAGEVHRFFSPKDSSFNISMPLAFFQAAVSSGFKADAPAVEPPEPPKAGGGYRRR